MPELQHHRPTPPATRGGMVVDGEELSSAYIRELDFMLILRMQLMCILILLVTVLHVVVFVPSARADIAKSREKTMAQSFGNL